jgi:hypothetical protein
MQNYSVYTARLTSVSYNNYITSFKAESTEAAKNKVTALHEIGGLNFNLYYYIIVEVNTGKIVWNQHEPEFKIWIKTPEAETAAELLKIFNKAHTILTASVLRADHLRNKAEQLTANRFGPWKNVNKWIEISNKADNLKRAADTTESRGRKVWAAVTDFQGKYINWRNLTKDGQQIYSLWTDAINYDNNLKAAQKIAGIQ